MSERRTRRRLSATTSVLLVTLAVTGGCTAEPGPARPAATQAEVQPVRREVACIDVTASIPHTFTRAALAWYADRITQAVTGPMPGATFYTRATSSQSYSPEAALGTVELPPVPAPPAAPTLPTNPYETSKRQALSAEFTAATAAWQHELAAARDRARSEAARLRDLPLPTDTTGTDVLGCELRAGELLAGAGTRNLFIAGDLLPNGPQQAVRPDLTGVDVTVAYWCAGSALDCINRRTAFTSLLVAAGAKDVHFLDPQQLTVRPGGTS